MHVITWLLGEEKRTKSFYIQNKAGLILFMEKNNINLENGEGAQMKKVLKYLFVIAVISSTLFITGCEMANDLADFLEFILSFLYMF